ncbi:MAG TPA: class I SAM-dependent methyltransferase [Acidobacteriota bacterium]
MAIMENKAQVQIRVNCPLCGASDFKLRFAARRGPGETAAAQRYCCTSPFLANHGDIVQCNHCRMLFSNPQPAPSEIYRRYREVVDPLYLEESAAREKTFARQLRSLRRFAAPPGKLLDVGCYTGVFMRLAAAAGWQVTGLELSAWAAAIARRAGCGEVVERELEKSGLEPESLDAVTLWDVVEHLGDPLAVLKQVHGLLRPGGIVALSTHLVDSAAARLSGRRYPFFMDMHLVHFSRPTLKRLLRESGFAIIAWQRHRRVLHLGYLLERLASLLPGPALRRGCGWLARRPLLSGRFVAVGFMGLADVYARKV